MKLVNPFYVLDELAVVQSLLHLITNYATWNDVIRDVPASVVETVDALVGYLPTVSGQTIFGRTSAVIAISGNKLLNLIPCKLELMMFNVSTFSVVTKHFAYEYFFVGDTKKLASTYLVVTSTAFCIARGETIPSNLGGFTAIAFAFPIAFTCSWMISNIA